MHSTSTTVRNSDTIKRKEEVVDTKSIIRINRIPSNELHCKLFRQLKTQHALQVVTFCNETLHRNGPVPFG
jgi:hypothetical protein